LYPPGSSFKIITSTVALETFTNAETVRFECKRLPDGRVGNYVRGWGKPIRDDLLDKEPHGSTDLAKELIFSRNAYAILIENGRYGGRSAAPAAAEIADAAVELGLIGRE